MYGYQSVPMGINSLVKNGINGHLLTVVMLSILLLNETVGHGLDLLYYPALSSTINK